MRRIKMDKGMIKGYKTIIKEYPEAGIVVAVCKHKESGFTLGKAIAKCRDGDVYDAAFGRKLAVYKLYEKCFKKLANEALDNYTLFMDLADEAGIELNKHCTSSDIYNQKLQKLLEDKYGK